MREREYERRISTLNGVINRKIEDVALINSVLIELHATDRT